MKYKNNLVLLVILITVVTTGLLLYVPTLAVFFKFETLNVTQLIISIGVGFIAVIWIELIKWRNRNSKTIIKL